MDVVFPEGSGDSESGGSLVDITATSDDSVAHNAPPCIRCSEQVTPCSTNSEDGESEHSDDMEMESSVDTNGSRYTSLDGFLVRDDDKDALKEDSGATSAESLWNSDDDVSVTDGQDDDADIEYQESEGSRCTGVCSVESPSLDSMDGFLVRDDDEDALKEDSGATSAESLWNSDDDVSVTDGQDEDSDIE